MDKRRYMTPEVEIFGFVPEKGFAASTESDITYDPARDLGFEDLE